MSKPITLKDLGIENDDSILTYRQIIDALEFTLHSKVDSKDNIYAFTTPIAKSIAKLSINEMKSIFKLLPKYKDAMVQVIGMVSFKTLSAEELGTYIVKAPIVKFDITRNRWLYKLIYDKKYCINYTSDSLHYYNINDISLLLTEDGEKVLAQHNADEIRLSVDLNIHPVVHTKIKYNLFKEATIDKYYMGALQLDLRENLKLENWYCGVIEQFVKTDMTLKELKALSKNCRKVSYE